MARNDVVIPGIGILAWSVLLCLLFFVQDNAHRRHNRAMMLEAAKACFAQIVDARAWNARHGGVYVPVGKDAAPNPDLPEEERTVETTTGRRLAKVNPATMTRQISEIAQREGRPRLHITSLDPLRPQNAPTDWEKRALERFEAGVAEVSELDEAARPPEFRYMAPLGVTETCLPCHAGQGYKVGDVRGGISVALPAGEYLEAQAAGLGEAAGLFLLIWGMGTGAIGYGAAAVLRGKRRAEAASKAKSTFLSILSHELRTPLNGVLGMIDLTLCTDLDAEQRAFLTDARQAGLVMNEQVRELLELSGLENGLGGLEVALFDPARFLGDVLARRGEEARAKGLEVVLRLEGELPGALLGDGARFARIVDILLDNAVKFTRAGEVRLTLSCSLTGRGRRRLTAAVADTGPGLAVDRLPTLFEPFSQEENVLTRSKDGLGVGLTIAGKHVELLHGSLTVASEPGQGATFTLTAPFRTPGAAFPDK